MTTEPMIGAARAVAFAARRIERALGDMTLPQFRVLSLIASSSERASHIAQLASVSRPSLTGLLDGLEARGWVRRVEVSGDRRGVRLEATAAGEKALARADAALAAGLGELLDAGAATADQRRQVVRGLTALGDVMRQAHAAQAHAHADHTTHPAYDHAQAAAGIRP